MRRTILFAPNFTRSTLRLIGLLLAALLVVLPSLPFGPWAASPPLPIAPLWAAYGWAADGEDSWRAPTALAALGLLEDQLSGGPLGFYALIFLIAFFIARVAANAMRTANLISPWTGFAATAAGACVSATIIAHWVLGQGGAIGTFALAALVTTILFPLVRPLYMGTGMTTAGART
jgi:rod shape-determining protein MreD